MYTSLLGEPTADRALEAQLRHEAGKAYWERAGRAGGAEPSAETLAADRKAAVDSARQALDGLEAQAAGGSPALYGRVGRDLVRYLRAMGQTNDAIEACQRVLSRLTEPDVERARTLYELGLCYHRRGEAGDLDKALERQKEALQIAGGLKDCPPELTGKINNALGLVHNERSEFSQAIERFAAAEPALREPGQADEHAMTLANLVLALAEVGDFDGVRTRLDQLRESPEAATNARTMAVIGLAALKLGDFAEAQQQFDLARHLAQQDPAMRGDTSFQVQLVTNAAACAQAAGDFSEAERLLVEAAREMERAKVDRRTASVIQANLGRMYLTLERLDEAEAQLGTVRATLAETQGENDPDTLRVALDLANLARARGFLVEAEESARAALDGLLKALGPEHSLVAEARVELAALYREQGRCADALDQATQALAALDAGLGADHKQSVTACLQAALLAADCRESPGGAEQFARLSRDARGRFARLRDELGLQNVEVLRAMVYSADLSAQTPESYEEALSTYQRAEEGFLKFFGDGALSVAALRLNQGRLLEKMDRRDEALQTCDEAYRRLDRSLKDHPIQAKLLEVMGDICAAKGDADRARQLWREAYRILAATYGPDDLRVKHFLEKRAQ